MKILLFCAKGFETMEFSVFIDVFGWARNDFQYDITVKTCGFSKQVISTFNVPIITDITLQQVCVDDYDALAIPGGFEEFGFYEEVYNESFLDLIREFNKQNKIIASVCVAALPIGKSGVLNNRNATTYHLKNGYRQKQLAQFGVRVVNKPVVVDDNIITSSCPQTAPYVAFELLKRLVGDEKMLAVKKAMGYSD